MASLLSGREQRHRRSCLFREEGPSLEEVDGAKHFSIRAYSYQVNKIYRLINLY